MTPADVAGVGAGPCAAGHLPAPLDPGACAFGGGLKGETTAPTKYADFPPPAMFLVFLGRSL